MKNEPVLYQYRMKPLFDEKFPWSYWIECSKEAYEQYKEKQEWGDWIYEVRALYLQSEKEPLHFLDIMEMYNEPSTDKEMIAFAREVERAHGIGVK